MLAPFLPFRASNGNRFASILTKHGQEATPGIQLPAGVAEVEVAYLERTSDGRLREPMARAVRLTI